MIGYPIGTVPIVPIQEFFFLYYVYTESAIVLMLLRCIFGNLSDFEDF
jgi:hypothetical protein